MFKWKKNSCDISWDNVCIHMSVLSMQLICKMFKYLGDYEEKAGVVGNRWWELAIYFFLKIT